MPYYKTDKITLYNGCCLDVMQQLNDDNVKVDMCLTDPPYGMTAAKWDSVIPLKSMWERVHNIVKFNGALCVFGCPPFSANLIMSNIDNFKYCWYWEKSVATCFQHSKNRPMAIMEEICVFSLASMGHKSLLKDKRMNYYPQGIKEAGKRTITDRTHGGYLGARPNQVGREYTAYTGFHNNLLKYNSVPKSKAIHVTEKPVDLLAYLIQCYTKEGDTVIDFTAGSGSTGEACLMTDRKCILIEKDKEMCEKIVERLGGGLLWNWSLEI